MLLSKAKATLWAEIFSRPFRHDGVTAPSQSISCHTHLSPSPEQGGNPARYISCWSSADGRLLALETPASSFRECLHPNWQRIGHFNENNYFVQLYELRKMNQSQNRIPKFGYCLRPPGAGEVVFWGRGPSLLFRLYRKLCYLNSKAEGYSRAGVMVIQPGSPVESFGE